MKLNPYYVIGACALLVLAGALFVGFRANGSDAHAILLPTPTPTSAAPTATPTVSPTVRPAAVYEATLSIVSASDVFGAERTITFTIRGVSVDDVTDKAQVALKVLNDSLAHWTGQADAFAARMTVPACVSGC